MNSIIKLIFFFRSFLFFIFSFYHIHYITFLHFLFRRWSKISQYKYIKRFHFLNRLIQCFLRSLRWGRIFRWSIDIGKRVWRCRFSPFSSLEKSSCKLNYGWIERKSWWFSSFDLFFDVVVDAFFQVFFFQFKILVRCDPNFYIFVKSLSRNGNQERCKEKDRRKTYRRC